MVRIIRHGDLLLREIKELPDQLKTTMNKVLAEGEVTGHKHKLLGNCQVLVSKEDKKYINVLTDCELVHQEHKTVIVEKGIYELLIEKEYNPFKEEILQVTD